MCSHGLREQGPGNQCTVSLFRSVLALCLEEVQAVFKTVATNNRLSGASEISLKYGEWMDFTNITLLDDAES